MPHNNEKKRQRGSSSTNSETDDMAGEISKSFKGLTKHLDDALAKFKQKIKNDLQTTAADLQKTAREVKDAVKSLESVWAEIKDLKEKQDVLNEVNETLKTACDELRCENLKLKKQIHDNQERVRKVEDYSRRENLIVKNIPENEDEDCLAVATDLIQELGVDTQNMQFHAVHRIGRKPAQTSSHEANNVEPKPRHIVARFLCREDRNRVWAKRKILRDTELCTDVFIDEDLSAAS